jgi:hypothetical protein
VTQKISYLDFVVPLRIFFSILPKVIKLFAPALVTDKPIFGVKKAYHINGAHGNLFKKFQFFPSFRLHDNQNNNTLKNDIQHNGLNYDT